MSREKVDVEDIIGIVKTEEPTNSVELKKELYKMETFKIRNNKIYNNGMELSLAESCSLLNEYKKIIEDYEYSNEELSVLNQELEEELGKVSEMKTVYAQLIIRLGKVLGYESSEEFFDAIDNGELW